MSDRQIIAEHATGLCVAGAAAMGLGVATANPLVSLSVLAAWGFDCLTSSPTRRHRALVSGIVKDMTREAPDDRGLTAAATLLKERSQKVSIDLASLRNAEHRQNFPDALYDMLFGDGSVPPDDGVEGHLRAALTIAYSRLRQEPDFDRVFIQESTLALEMAVKTGFAETHAKLHQIQADVTVLAENLAKSEAREQANHAELMAALRDPKHSNRDNLEALAARFRIPDAFDLPDARLRAELYDRAREYDALRKQVAALDGRTALIANLKAAATDALDRLDFEKAAQLFAHIRASQADLAIETAWAEADMLLLLNQVEAARDLLLDTADGYKRRDRKAWLRLTDNAALRFYKYGLSHSGPAIAIAAEIWTELLRSEGAELKLESCAALQNNIGFALLTLGYRENKSALYDAETAFCAALEGWTRDAFPYEWAGVKNNLGNVYSILGSKGDDLKLQSAVAAYCDALKIRTRNAHPEEWAETQNNLGNAKQNIGELGDVAALHEAIDAFRNALKVRTRKALPEKWAMTQNNLGIAFKTLGKRGDDASLQKAVKAYRAALEVRTRDALPVDWAMTRMNLAVCLLVMSTTDQIKAPIHLAEALTAIDDALKIYTTEHMPFDHEQATAVRARILAAQALP